MKFSPLVVAVVLSLSASAIAGEIAPLPKDTSRGDRMIAEYFKGETAKLQKQLLKVKTLKEWEVQRTIARKQLQEMLGLSPWPDRTPLQTKITGTVDHESFTVEKLHFQSRPGLYVTGNLYVPKKREGKLPAILYVCGHGRVKENGVSYGNKVHYHHHGSWFARNGYVCLTIDTLQLGEIEGLHHGTYREGMWWWNSRGYTPAGVEAWNCVRALDYLESRPEVDPHRMGVTGRSGGGAYSWWAATLDERIKVAVPVAGITNLQNHIVDGCVEGHCDCMFMVNTYRWDYAQVAALMAPRPLLISNTDKDRIFPLDGVVDVYNDVKHIYSLYGATDKLGLHITEGPHKDTQELRMHAFRWFNKYLKNDGELIETAAHKYFTPQQLKVFEKLPADEKNTKIQETFTKTADTPAIPETQADWEKQRDLWREQLLTKSFVGWPKGEQPLNLKQVFTANAEGVTLSAYDFTSQENIELRLYVTHRAGLTPEDIKILVLNPMGDKAWSEFLAAMRVGFAEELKEEDLPPADAGEFQQTRQLFERVPWAMAYVAPRGIGRTAWNRSEKKQVQNRRRFMLLGQTLDSMRVWDIRRASQAVRSIPGFEKTSFWLQGDKGMSGLVLYAAMFEPNVTRVDLWDLPVSHQNGPTFLNVMRYLDIPQAVALTADKHPVIVYNAAEGIAPYPKAVANKLNWDKKQLRFGRVEQTPE